MNAMKILIGLGVAAVVGIMGMYLLPSIVPFIISWTTNAKASGILQPGTNVTIMADFWPLILLGVVGAIMVACIIWASRGGGGGGMQQ